MHEHFLYNDSEVAEGLKDGWLKGNPPFYDVEVMPQWSDSRRTHYQMYETCSEGTPISPVMKTPEELAAWLAENKASAFADMTADYETWLGMIKGPGHSPSAVIMGGKMISGVEAVTDG